MWPLIRESVTQMFLRQTKACPVVFTWLQHLGPKLKHKHLIKCSRWYFSPDKASIEDLQMHNQLQGRLNCYSKSQHISRYIYQIQETCNEVEFLAD